MTDMTARTRDGQRFLKARGADLLGFDSADGKVVITTKDGAFTAETENAAIKRFNAGELDPVEPGADHPSYVTHKALCAAFDHFNRTLFEGRLPIPVIVVHRKRGAHGYFWAERWSDGGDSRRHEIALNPETMGRSPREVLSTLVHEMTHLEQQIYGKPSPGNHNVAWGTLMDRVGLTPTATGLQGGKRTGRSVTHFIEPGGPFDVACATLLAQDFKLPVHAVQPLKLVKPDRSKTCFVCPECGQKAWANFTASLVCGADRVCMNPKE